MKKILNICKGLLLVSVFLITASGQTANQPTAPRQTDSGNCLLHQWFKLQFARYT